MFLIASRSSSNRSVLGEVNVVVAFFVPPEQLMSSLRRRPSPIAEEVVVELDVDVDVVLDAVTSDDVV